MSPPVLPSRVLEKPFYQLPQLEQDSCKHYCNFSGDQEDGPASEDVQPCCVSANNAAQSIRVVLHRREELWWYPEILIPREPRAAAYSIAPGRYVRTILKRNNVPHPHPEVSACVLHNIL
jgi:hypothetical protein